MFAVEIQERLGQLPADLEDLDNGIYVQQIENPSKMQSEFAKRAIMVSTFLTTTCCLFSLSCGPSSVVPQKYIHNI